MGYPFKVLEKTPWMFIENALYKNALMLGVENETGRQSKKDVPKPWLKKSENKEGRIQQPISP